FLEKYPANRLSPAQPAAQPVAPAQAIDPGQATDPEQATEPKQVSPVEQATESEHAPGGSLVKKAFVAFIMKADGACEESASATDINDWILTSVEGGAIALYADKMWEALDTLIAEGQALRAVLA